MKPVYLSLKWYLIILLSLVALLGSAVFVWHALKSFDERNTSDVERLVDGVRRHYEQLVETEQNKLSDMTVILPLVKLDSENAPDYTSLLETLWEDIELFWSIDNVIVYDASGAVKFTNYENEGDELPLSDELHFGQHPAPLQRVLCKTECQLFHATPLVTEDGFVGYLVFARSLNRVLNILSKTQDVRAGIVKNMDALSDVTIYGDVFSEAIFSYLNEQLKGLLPSDLNKMVAEFGGAHIQFHVIPIKGNQGGLSLTFSRDVTKLRLATAAYVRQSLAIALCILLLAVFVGYLFIRPIIFRLKNLAEVLPQVGDSSKPELNKLLFEGQSKYLSSELDVVAHSSRAMILSLARTSRREKRRTKALETMAMTDSLTGLPNRNMLTYELEKLVAELSRRSEYAAVCLLDIDDFKLVNDTLGHAEGDVLIQRLAERLTTNSREQDSVFRLGGDEFVVVIRGLAHADSLQYAMIRMLKSFDQDFQLSSRSFKASFSVGVASISGDIEVDDILKQADMAMYRAKREAGNSYVIFSGDLADLANQRLQVLSTLPRAFENNEFELYLQPQIKLEDMSVMGFEALIRWRDPELGLIFPDNFIPHLEHSPYMLELSYWVVKESIRQIKALEDAGYTGLKVAINLSPQQFADSDLLDIVLSMINSAGIEPELLHLEITESSVMKDLPRAIEIIKALRKNGFKVAMDDFGTGHSSLSQLKLLPLDTLKIDRAFVSGMLESELDYQIVKSTIEFARVLNMNIVAEGVEGKAEQEILLEMGADIGQGWYYAKALPLDETLEWLAKAPKFLLGLKDGNIN